MTQNHHIFNAEIAKKLENRSFFFWKIIYEKSNKRWMLGWCSQRFSKCLMKISRVRVSMAIDAILKKIVQFVGNFQRVFKILPRFWCQLCPIKLHFREFVNENTILYKLNVNYLKKVTSTKYFGFHWLNLENDEIET